MSEDRRKNLRTQGKYGDGKVRKCQDKKQRSSLGSKDSPEMRLPKRNSEGSQSANNSLNDENPISLEYKEKSDYTFHQLEEPTKPEEIKERGDIILSETDSGQSRILYDPRFLYEDEADDYFNRLQKTVQFDSRNIIIHGVEYPQPRLVAWFGPFPYSYSGVTLDAAEMPDVVLEIKEKVEAYLKSQNIEATFNSVLINLYRNGKDSVSWHSDDEIMLGICPTIASVSLGETRKFEIRPKIRYQDSQSPSDSTCKYLINLVHGSLVVMTGAMQDDWQHRVPKEYHDRHARINLTFRTVYPLDKVIHLVRKRRSLKRKSWNITPLKRSSFYSKRLSLCDTQLSHNLYMNDEEIHEQGQKRKLSDSYFNNEENMAQKQNKKLSYSYMDDEETRKHSISSSHAHGSDEEISAQDHRKKSLETHELKYKRKPPNSCDNDEEIYLQEQERKPSDSYVSDEETHEQKYKRKPSDSCNNDEEIYPQEQKRQPSDSSSDSSDSSSDEETYARKHSGKSSDNINWSLDY